MKRAAVILGVLAIGLSACGPDPEGVGFTGIGNDPVDVARSDPFSDQRLSNGASYVPPVAQSSVPLIKVASNSYSPSVMAEKAIRNGGQTKDRAKRVTLGGEEVMLSRVQVANRLYLVARAPRSVWSQSIKPGTDRVFVSSVTQLTGCQAQGGLYRYGESKTQPRAMAVELSCL